VPSDEVYHAVAFEPIIANKDVMHHMILFACGDDVTAGDPHLCGAEDLKCETWLTVWTVGLEGQICTHHNTGAKFGRGSMRHMSLQIHWNNPDLRGDYVDSSGMRIYYTPRLRKYDLGNVQFGQNYLAIPPLSRDYEQHGGCTPYCTKKRLPHPIYLTRTYLHMHHLATAGAMEQYRNGKLIRVIALDPEYQYVTPPIHVHDPAVEILPGDEVLVRCWYNTLDGDRRRYNTTLFGLGTDAEMCYAFVSYFPAVPRFDQCAQFQSLETGECARKTGRIGECDVASFLNLVSSTLSNEILANCHLSRVCHAQCYLPLQELFNHVCMKGPLAMYFTQNQLMSVPAWPRIVNIYNHARTKC
ncbi:DBH-like monooxygenase protein 1 homolog, partial [Lingula anatina]|uniref:DBH-like monooxygenase protein 1 homolog n=1 Tax=Lingula anatina TaxID=7574 RepID=A0A1S3IK66_LINAN